MQRGLILAPLQPANVGIDEHLISVSEDSDPSHSFMVPTFDRRVALTPEHSAISSTHGVTTYRELKAMADSIEGFLRTFSAGTTRRPIGVMMRDSLYCSAAILGTAKADRICMPLEVDLPEARLSLILRKSDAELVITESGSTWLARRAAPDGCQVIPIGKALSYGSSPKLEPNEPSSNMAAFIIYTSGSTGTPKGVVHGHRYLPHFTNVWSQTVQLESRDRVCILYGCGVSSGLNRSLATLLTGACLFPFDVNSRGLNGLAEWIESCRITVLVMAASLFRAWLSCLPADCRFPRLRLIEVATEPVSGIDVSNASRHLENGWKIVNVYGASEVGMIASAAFGPADAVGRGILPVGTSPAGQRVCIFREDGSIAAPGERGEIGVKSPSLALGYWNDEKLTSANFHTDTADGNRVYRSGDIGCFNNDGHLEHLGRKDRKIKISGYSVEPYEVECALRRLFNVHDAVVLADDIDNDNKRLIAYVAIPEGRSPELEETLRAQLEAQLPSYMVPSAIIVLSAMPLTKRGKIDREALPRPLALGSLRRRDIRLPTDDVEHVLAAIWRDVLNIRELGIEDKFHELGGTSLQAITMLGRIAKTFDCDLPISVMVTAPTIAGQAAILRRELPLPDWSMPTLLRDGSTTPLFVIHAAFGSILFAHDLVRHLKSDRPVYGIQAPPLNGTLNGYLTIEAIAANYLAEIRRVQPQGPYLLAGYSFGGWVAFEIAQQLGAQAQSVSFLGLIDPIRLAPWREGLADRAERHLANVREQNLRGKVRYLEQLFRGLLGYRLARWQLQLSRRFPKWFVGQPPHQYRSTLYNEIFPQATRQYEPKPYHGSAVIFSSDGLRDAQENYWRSFVKGELSVTDIPVEHLEMIRPPHNVLLARQLDAWLERTRP